MAIDASGVGYVPGRTGPRVPRSARFRPGNRCFSEYEEWRTQTLGDAATRPHRITYRKLTSRPGLDGDTSHESVRNEPCPCGSGEKATRCCLGSTGWNPKPVNVSLNPDGNPRRHPGCFLERFGGCSDRIPWEHFMSRALLRRMQAEADDRGEVRENGGGKGTTTWRGGRGCSWRAGCSTFALPHPGPSGCQRVRRRRSPLRCYLMAPDLSPATH